MTLPADDNSDKETPPPGEKPEGSKHDADKKPVESEAGKALAPAASSPVNPFLAAASEAEEKIDAPAMPRSLASRMLDYSAHAAIIVGLIGFAWTVSDHVVSRPGADKAAAQPVAAAAMPAQVQKVDEMTQLRQANLRMHEEIRALKSSVDTLRTTIRRDTTSEQVRMLSAGLDSMKGSIGTMRSETSSAIAQLTGKVDKLQPGKVRDLNDRLGRLEHQATDPTATGSIGKTDVRRSDNGHADIAKSVPPKPPAKPAALASLEEPQASKPEEKPQVLSGFSVRDVYRGVALIESRHGTMEAVPGVSIPGAGVVKSIDRKGGTWTVTTSKGQIASAAPTPRSYRQGPPSPYGYGYGRGGYAPYRYGY